MTKFLDTLTTLVDSRGEFYYRDADNNYYRMVEMDEDFDFIDEDDAEIAYISVDENNCEL